MKLPLAVDIADAVITAQTTGADINVPLLAGELSAQHPEADATPEEVAEALEQEMSCPAPPSPTR